MKFLSPAFSLLLLICLLSNCETAIIDNPKSIDINQTALDYLNQGDYPNAVNHFKKALALKPLTIETQQIILRNIAISYYDTDQVDSSILYFKKAIDISPKETYEYYVCLLYTSPSPRD